MTTTMIADGRNFSGELDMTVNLLIQVDKLVQLIESPVFTCKEFQFPRKMSLHFVV